MMETKQTNQVATPPKLKTQDYNNIILDAFSQEDGKMHELREKAIMVDKILKDKLELMKEARRIYSIVFKNFISVKKSVLTNFGKDHEEIFLNRDGISVKSSYGHNSVYIDSANNSHRDFFAYLKRLKEDVTVPLTAVEKLMAAIPREDKKEILRKYWEKIEQVEVENNYEYELKTPTTIPLSMLNFQSMKFELNKNGQMHQEKIADLIVTWLYSKDPSTVALLESDPKKVATNFHRNEYSQIDLRNPDLSDRMLISLFYTDVWIFYEEYRASEQVKLEKLQDFVEDIKCKFKNYLVLESLKPIKQAN